MFLFRKLLHSFGVANFAPPEGGGMKFSEAIRKANGEGWYESHGSYNHCAIGSAYKGKTGKRLLNSSDSPPSLRGIVAKEFGIPVAVVAKADFMHRAGVSRMMIAKVLELEGF